MSDYIKHTWQNGEPISADKLNNMETGIAEANKSAENAAVAAQNTESIAKSMAKYDLVIGLNANAEKDSDYFVYENVSPEDFQILSGDLASVVEKVKQGIFPKVLLKEMQFYGEYSFSKGLAEATHISITNDNDYNYSEATRYKKLAVTFKVHYLPSYSLACGYEILLLINADRNAVELAYVRASETRLVNS